jgi:hypothetical protein
VVARYAERLTGRGGTPSVLTGDNGVLSGVRMMYIRVKVVKIDDNHRLYLYRKKVVFKEKVNGRYITRFSGVSISGLLQSELISEEVKEKLREKLKDLP